jgi:glyoxylase-like metal-dependent hydrolase (beta-lactamase superfamily II)
MIYFIFAPMKVHQFTFSPFQENTYILTESNKCLIIDPGCYDQTERNILFNFIKQKDLEPLAIVNTHCHIDHVFGVKAVVDEYQIPFLCDSRDMDNLKRSANMASQYGLDFDEAPEPNAFLDELKNYSFGPGLLELRFTPGHAPGHQCFVNHDEKWVIAGDTLFQLSIGRTDLPGGNHQELLNSIKRELFSLPDDYQVFSGHGASTNIGFEKKHNPFMKGWD